MKLAFGYTSISASYKCLNQDIYTTIHGSGGSWGITADIGAGYGDFSALNNLIGYKPKDLIGQLMLIRTSAYAQNKFGPVNIGLDLGANSLPWYTPDNEIAALTFTAGMPVIGLGIAVDLFEHSSDAGTTLFSSSPASGSFGFGLGFSFYDMIRIVSKSHGECTNVR